MQPSALAAQVLNAGHINYQQKYAIISLMADKQEKQLLQFFKGLDDSRRLALLEYAEFLYQRSEKIQQPLAEPDLIARPDQETVVGAIKRLTASYAMLDKQYMLHELSSLMAQHMLQGRPASDVIDDIEAVFASQYRQLLEKQEH
jgi:hypothetical protein